MTDSYVALDLETTGLSPDNCYILEIGAVKVVENRVVDTYETLVQCPIAIDARIQQLTGITDEMVSEGKPEAQAVEELLEFSKDFVLLGHNIQFDYGFVKAAALRNGRKYVANAIDTLKIARKVLPDVEKKSLEYLCRYYQIETKASHRALEDARAAMELYKILAAEFASQEKLFEPERMHVKIKKKEPITNAQKGYLGDLLKYHGLELEMPMEELSKSEASRRIDEIIREHGKIQRFR